MSVLHVCQHCQATFETKNRKGGPYCSYPCRKYARRPPRRCLTCGVTFQPGLHTKGTRRFYCSRVCRTKIAIVYPSLSLHEYDRITLEPTAQKSLDGWYRKDETLYGIKVPYTVGATTWYGIPCCYCGDPYEDDEHVLPISAFSKMLAVGGMSIARDLLRLVPACHECNSILTDKVFETFEDKRQYLKFALMKRYHNVLKWPAWSDGELATLTGNLYRWIATGDATQAHLASRLRY